MFNQVYKVLAFKGSSTPTDTRTHHQIQEALDVPLCSPPTPPSPPLAVWEPRYTPKCQIYARGDNGYGQLGVNSCDSHTATRKLVKSLARKVTVQLACDANHTLALTADGDKIPWASWHLDTDRGPRRTLPW
ncbi:uncharacterized protein LOC135097733 isoform X4 [Scylla paramamosain]|uniref:uncharacterized protein LOC135097733 isoform X4 n=1 Tax=Scylla paramamosain TaxID=85552 RepID=UPI003082C68A